MKTCTVSPVAIGFFPINNLYSNFKLEFFISGIQLSTLTMSGVSFANAQLMVRRYVGAIRWSE